MAFPGAGRYFGAFRQSQPNQTPPHSLESHSREGQKMLGIGGRGATPGMDN